MARILTGVLLAAAWLILLLYASFYMFGVSVCVLGAIGLHEYFQITAGRKEKSVIGVNIFLGLLPLFAALGGHLEFIGAALFLSIFILAIFTLQNFGSMENGLQVLAKQAFGIIYIGFFLAHLILIRAESQGSLWILVLTAIIAASDTGAYYFGSWFGKRKLIPQVSPGKTWVGAIGGVGAGLVAALFSTGLLFQDINYMRVGIFSICLVLVGMVGDLLESVIKRSVGVKDSGHLLAGHGGLLDRGDSLLLAAPALYYLIRFGVFPGS